MTNPAFTIALKLHGTTCWLDVAADALPRHSAVEMDGLSTAELAELYGPLIHAVVIDKVQSGESKLRDRYALLVEDFL